MFPVVAPLGTGAAMLVALQLVGVAAVPLNVTVLLLCKGITLDSGDGFSPPTRLSQRQDAICPSRILVDRSTSTNRNRVTGLVRITFEVGADRLIGRLTDCFNCRLFWGKIQ